MDFQQVTWFSGRSQIAGFGPAGLRADLRSAAKPMVHVWVLLFGALVYLTGCQQPMHTPTAALRVGDYANPRRDLYENLEPKRSDRAYLLDRMRVGVLALADGQPGSAQTIFEEVYDVLRTQGINRDKTVASLVLNEDVKVWKGEPFEQALALAYYGMTQAELGSWDNTRAAANGSLFQLRDFGEDEKGERIDTYEITRRAVEYERAIEAGDSPDEALSKANYLDNGYVVRDSDFTLGYLLAGIANQQLGRTDEADDQFLRVSEIDDRLTPLTEALRKGGYNTVLIVSHGLGPQKQGYGPDNALARFAPRFPSDDAELLVRVGDSQGRAYPLVLDVNAMAGDHMWNNLEDVRAAKSTIGTLMIYGGAIATNYGASNSGNDDSLYIGLGAMLAGAIMKAGAHVDTRYCDVMPQRFYVVPLYLNDASQRIELEVQGRGSSRLVLAGLGPPTAHGPGGAAQLRYVRLVSHQNPAAAPPRWAVSGQVYYEHDYDDDPQAGSLPYILGGNDVRPPTQRMLNRYHQRGLLNDMTLADLRERYRERDIQFTLEDQQGFAGKHVLEGGHSLVVPLPGTTGFARLFGQAHPTHPFSNPDNSDTLFQNDSSQGDTP